MQPSIPSRIDQLIGDDKQRVVSARPFLRIGQSPLPGILSLSCAQSRQNAQHAPHRRGQDRPKSLSRTRSPYPRA